MKIGGIDVITSSDTQAKRLTLLLWGMSGVGKTTLAATMPGRKLLLNLDPDGHISVSNRNDVDILDLSALSTDDVLNKLKSDNNPLNLEEALKHGTYQSVILDSATSLSQRALENAVKQRLGASARSNFTPSMEAPGLAAYGGRNAILLTCIKGLLRVTGRYNCHCCIISHEDEPKISDAGEVLYITMMLGGKLVSNVSLQLSEVWFMSESSGEKKLAIRPCRSRKPMKTRMFVANSNPEFPVSFNPDLWEDLDNNPIAKWWNEWEKGGGAKLSLPSVASKPALKTVSVKKA